MVNSFSFTVSFGILIFVLPDTFEGDVTLTTQGAVYPAKLGSFIDWRLSYLAKQYIDSGRIGILYNNRAVRFLPGLILHGCAQ